MTLLRRLILFGQAAESRQHLINTIPAIQHWWSADGTLWQDSARTTPAVAHGDKVGAIDDLVPGSACHALQTTDANRVSLNINGLGQKVFVSDTGLGAVTPAFVAFPSKRGCIFITYSNGAAINFTVVAATYNQAGSIFALYSTITGATKFKFYDGVHAVSTDFDGTQLSEVEEFWRTGDTAMQFYRNGVLADNLTISNIQQSNLPFYLFGNSSSYAFATGRIKDVVVTSNITAAERLRISNFLNNHPIQEVVIGFGDSITAGTGASDAAHRWLNLVNADSKCRFANLINSGVSGSVVQNTVQNTIAVIGGAVNNNGQDNLAARVTVYKPTRVFVLYGLNDVRFNDVAFTVTTFQNSLTAVVNAIIASGVPAGSIVLGSPPYMDPAKYGSNSPFNAGSTPKYVAYTAAAAAVANSLSTRYADVYNYMLNNGDNSLMSADGIHPNDAGHAAIATAFLSVL